MGKKKEQRLLERADEQKKAFADTLRELRRIQQFSSVKRAQEEKGARPRPGQPYVETFRLRQQER